MQKMKNNEQAKELKEPNTNPASTGGRFTMRSMAAALASAILGVALINGAGCQNPSTSHSVLGGVGAGALAGGLSRVAGASTEASIAIGAGVGLATAVAIHVIEQRRATEREQELARQRAAQQLEPVEPQRRQELKEQNTHVAVTVGEDAAARQKEVMIVDPVTGQPVNDTVYVVDASDPAVASGEKVDLGGYDAIYVN
jgi:hypothetical protein